MEQSEVEAYVQITSLRPFAILKTVNEPKKLFINDFGTTGSYEKWFKNKK